MTESRKQAKRRHTASRTALTQKNIVEHSMEECKKVEQRNRSLNVKTLRTDPALLQGVFYVSPKPPIQTTTEQYPK